MLKFQGGLFFSKQSFTFTFLPPPLFFFFSFSFFLPHGDGNCFNEKMCSEKKTVTSQAVEGTWIHTGGYGRLRGEWGNFAIFPQSRIT